LAVSTLKPKQLIFHDKARDKIRRDGTGRDGTGRDGAALAEAVKVSPGPRGEP
jgi:hypothetical protein